MTYQRWVKTSEIIDLQTRGPNDKTNPVGKNNTRGLYSQVRVAGSCRSATSGLRNGSLALGGSFAEAQTVPFTPLHIYYISPTGNDANPGTSPSKAWAGPRHNVVCGDVIIAAPGSYAAEYSEFGPNTWGTVSNCPSTSGGIDGKGGIYFATLLCAGPYVTSCSVNGGAYRAVRVDKSNWAVEGFDSDAKLERR